MNQNTYRHERKLYISPADRIELRSRLRHIALPDPNADESGCYNVRSLYFDNYNDKAVTDKLSGQSRREKFRLRFYNGDTSFLRLEKKSKINRRCLKQTAVISLPQCKSILNGVYDDLKNPETPLLSELYAKIRFQHLRPKVIVDYTREAYIFKAGNVRVTIDSDVCAGTNPNDFLCPDFTAIPSANAIVLEIKYDNFLPDIIRDVLQIKNRHETEFSKYVVSRLI